jgi:hypothetical protein
MCFRMVSLPLEFTLSRTMIIRERERDSETVLYELYPVPNPNPNPKFCHKTNIVLI